MLIYVNELITSSVGKTQTGSINFHSRIVLHSCRRERESAGTDNHQIKPRIILLQQQNNYFDLDREERRMDDKCYSIEKWKDNARKRECREKQQKKYSIQNDIYWILNKTLSLVLSNVQNITDLLNYGTERSLAWFRYNCTTFPLCGRQFWLQ